MNERTVGFILGAFTATAAWILIDEVVNHDKYEESRENQEKAKKACNIYPFSSPVTRRGLTTRDLMMINWLATRNQRSQTAEILKFEK